MKDSKDFVANGTGGSAEFSNPSCYSDSAFWAMVKRFAKKAGVKVVYLALVLYYALVSPNTPGWAKTAIISALAYFICPVDLISDAIPIIGYTDDFAALTAAYEAVEVCVTTEIVAQAKAKVGLWFGKVDEAVLA